MHHLNRTQLFLLTAASAVVVANAYYLHPIIALVADDFGVNHSLVGLVPAMNQIALALGIFLLLPLGDWVSNKKLVLVSVAAQVVALVGMALIDSFYPFVIASAVLGFFTITPYILPTYASKRVPPNQLGYVTAMLTTGVIAGVLLSRTGAGIIAENVGWRAVYWVAASLMLTMSILLPLIMEEPSEEKQAGQTYPALIASMLTIAKNSPGTLISGAIQGLNFGIFIAVWMGLGLHLTSPEMGYGVDVVGYLAGFSLLNLVTTPRLGAWADRIGARKARLRVTSIQIVGVSLLYVFGGSLWLLMIPIVIMNLVGPIVDVTGRMTFLKEPPEIRTRLMTMYIVLMFIGGGLASWAGTVAYDLAGWSGNALLALGISVVVLTLSAYDFRRAKNADNTSAP